MKHLTTIILTACLLAVPMTGCKKAATTPTQAIAPGYNNSADEIMGTALSGANGFYLHVQADIAAGKYTPGTSERTMLQSFNQALIIANTTYVAYHAGQTTQAAAQAAIDKATAIQTQIQNAIPSEVKP